MIVRVLRDFDVYWKKYLYISMQVGAIFFASSYFLQKTFRENVYLLSLELCKKEADRFVQLLKKKKRKCGMARHFKATSFLFYLYFCRISAIYHLRNDPKCKGIIRTLIPRFNHKIFHFSNFSVLFILFIFDSL